MRAPAALVLCAALGCASIPGGVEHPLVGEEIPDFQRAAIGGAPVETRALRGSVTVLAFCATYAAGCPELMQALERLRRRFPQVVPVLVLEERSAALAEEARQRLGLTIAVVYDGDAKLRERFAAGVLPTTLIADRDGSVRWAGGPGHGEAEIARALHALGGEGDIPLY